MAWHCFPHEALFLSCCCILDNIRLPRGQESLSLVPFLQSPLWHALHTQRLLQLQNSLHFPEHIRLSKPLWLAHTSPCPLNALLHSNSCFTNPESFFWTHFKY